MAMSVVRAMIVAGLCPRPEACSQHGIEQSRAQHSTAYQRAQRDIDVSQDWQRRSRDA